METISTIFINTVHQRTKWAIFYSYAVAFDQEMIRPFFWSTIGILDYPKRQTHSDMGAQRMDEHGVSFGGTYWKTSKAWNIHDLNPWTLMPHQYTLVIKRGNIR